jgi:hypothetical protein
MALEKAERLNASSNAEFANLIQEVSEMPGVE